MHGIGMSALGVPYGQKCIPPKGKAEIMPRTVKEWIGKNDDSKAPPRVRQRCHDRAEGKCHICGLPIGRKKWELDHIIALINGGENRESNLAPAHITCHKTKTDKDKKTKAKIAKARGRHTGANQPKGNIQSQGFAKSAKKTKIDKSAIPPLYYRPMFRKVKT